MRRARIGHVTTGQGGFALVEAMVAAVVLAVGLLGTIGLQARSLGALQDSAMRAEATMAAEKLIGMMTTDQANLAAYALASGATPSARLQPWVTETRSRIPNALIQVGVATAAGTAVSQVAVTIAWTRKAGSAQNQYRVSTYIARSS